MSTKVVSITVLLVLLGFLAWATPAVTAAPADQATTQLTNQPTNPAATPLPQEEDNSILPEGLSRVFAALGLYIVTMFTMAIGTEIVVDVIKLAVGLKSKPTAQDTLKKYEAILPGSLENLGLSAEARYNLEIQVSRLQRLLTPVFRAEQLIADLKTEDFTAVLQTRLAVTEIDEAAAAVLEQAAVVAKAQLNAALDALPTESALGQSIEDRMRQDLSDRIDMLAEQAGNITPKQLFRQARSMLNGRLADSLTDWVEAQLGELHDVSYETAVQVYNTQINPLIAASGLNQETEDKIERQFEDLLQNIQNSHATDALLHSLNALLQEVERQRDELASHWRKWGRYVINGLRERVRFLQWLPQPRAKLDPTIKQPGEAASKLLEISRRDKEEGNARIQQLRLMAVLIGIMLAYILQIDSADLLRDLFPANANFLRLVLISGDSMLFNWLEARLHIPFGNLTAGIILTGLAASAGSGFWHDQLSRLQSVKQTTEAAFATLQTIQKTAVEK